MLYIGFYTPRNIVTVNRNQQSFIGNESLMVGGGLKGASQDLNGALSSREAAEIRMVSMNIISRYCTTKTRLDFL